MGLAAVADVLRSYSGGIDVETRQGKGTTFRVLLPVVEKNGSGQTADGVEPQGPTVMVVDDEVSVRDFIATVLRRHGTGC